MDGLTKRNVGTPKACPMVFDGGQSPVQHLLLAVAFGRTFKNQTLPRVADADRC